ncbi:MAG: hypothetical protein GX913_02215 [Clostridiales bacterium]|nr:hypothetical protein [Clostridiales bacterium]
MKKTTKTMTILFAVFTMLIGTATISNAAVANGWEQKQEGREIVWHYYQNSRMMQNQWLNTAQNGLWYYFDYDGAMETGWGEDEVTGYYFDASGAMATGWKKLSKSVSSGPASGSSNAWYYFHSSGEMATGWQYLGNSWYFFSDGFVDGFVEGEMVYGLVEIDGENYYFGNVDQGSMKTGFQTVTTSTTVNRPGGSSTTNKTYFFESDGTMRQAGWAKEGSYWYYFTEDGLMATGNINIDSNDFYLDPTTGRMQTGWVLVKASQANSPTASTGSFYQFYNDDGTLKTGWLNTGGKWYYLAKEKDINNGKGMEGKALGEMAVGLVENIDDGGTFYFTTSGSLVQNNWQTISGIRYYFGSGGKMYKSDVANEVLVASISSRDYAFDQDGVMLKGTSIYYQSGKWTKTAPSGSYKTADVNNSGVVGKAN